MGEAFTPDTGCHPVSGNYTGPNQKTYNLRSGPPVVPPVEALEGPSAGTSSQADWTGVTCQLCGKPCVSKRGLGVHLRAAHKAAANDRITVPAVKVRWSDEELRVLANKEAEATPLT